MGDIMTFVGTVTTESGSRYQFDGLQVRRVNTRHDKRGDNEWQPVVRLCPEIPVAGSDLWITMKSLKRYGADDIGTPVSLADDVTIRRTTMVIKVDHE